MSDTSLALLAIVWCVLSGAAGADLHSLWTEARHRCMPHDPKGCER